ncbi:hypothetical protein [Bounagaea algeriensis]
MLVREEYKPVAQTSGEEVELPPWPSEWKMPGGIKPTVGVVAFGAFGMAAGVAGLVQLATGTFGDSTIILLAGAVFALSLTSATALLRLRVRQRGTSAVYTSHTRERREPSTVIPNLRGVWLMALTVLASALVMFGLVATVSWGFLLTGTETSLRMIFQALLSTTFVVGIIWVFSKASEGVIAQGSLTLTAGGVTHKAWGPERHIPWEALDFIFPAPGENPNIALSYDSRRVTVPAKRKDDILPLSGNLLSVDPALAYHALAYYLDHPEARSELGTERSVERIRQADFPE